MTTDASRFYVDEVGNELLLASTLPLKELLCQEIELRIIYYYRLLSGQIYLSMTENRG